MFIFVFTYDNSYQLHKCIIKKDYCKRNVIPNGHRRHAIRITTRRNINLDLQKTRCWVKNLLIFHVTLEPYSYKNMLLMYYDADTKNGEVILWIPIDLWNKLYA